MASSENSSSDDYFPTSQEVNRKESEVEIEFSEDEESLIIRMYKLVGDRWSLIAGRIPGRNADQIKKYWISRRYPTSAFRK
ncbi:hypothetical protein ABFX02_13G120500 [Erythranthe guttata]